MRICGTLNKWLDDRGYGFIARDDGEPDVFCHIKGLERGGIPDPQVGDRLEFEISAGRGGKFEAVEIRDMNDAPMRDAG